MITTKVKSPIVILLAIIVAGIVVVNLMDELPVVEETAQKSFNIQSWTTANGAQVLFVEAPELPMLDIRVVFDAGSAQDNGRPGLASMTNLMLDQGAGQWSTDEIAERLDSIGARIGTNAQRDMAVVSLRSLTEKPILDKALETFSAVLHQPRFPERDLDRERKQILIALQNMQQSPDEIAEMLFYKTLYGKHPYATPTLGTPESVRGLTRADLQTFYKKYYVASNAVIAMVGDIDKEQARAISEKLSAGLQRGKPAEMLPLVEKLQKAAFKQQQHPSTQTHIMVGQPGMTRGDDDYFVLYLGNHILGGSGFSSRIVEEIREKRGLAYSSYSYFLPMRRQGPFMMGLQTANHNAQQAQDLLKATLQTFIDKGPTDAELEHAKQNITGGFPLRIDSNKDIVEYLAMIGFYNLPHDYLQTFNNKIMDVSKQQIKAVFKKRIDPDRMVTVLVGNPGKPKKSAK
ncbi:MAG: insulinase family protein [Gammaproteobacteria bacterium]|nr:insulinase family protein [Gammaproteobacteria bacterium]MDH5653254.1 insulinase family protein [Gammaproteobacteria bacterium]